MPTKNGSKRKKIIVIGAGLAGLSCAYELSKKDCDIVILEARDRLGGRVHTLTERFTSGLSAEAGAFWIHHNHQAVNYYLYELGLMGELVPGGGALSYHVDGKRLSNAFSLKAPLPNMGKDEAQFGLGGLVAISLCGHNFGDPSAIDWPPQELRDKYTNTTFYQYLRMQKLPTRDGPKDITQAAVDFMLPWFNWWDDLKEVSALMLIRDSIISRRMCDPPQWFTLKHGMKQIPIRFLEELAKANGEARTVKINYRAPVIGIRQNAGTVTATYRLQSGHTDEVTGDYMVCAIPFSTLRDIKELPEFSSDKRNAIKTLRYVPVARIYLEYEKPFHVLPNGAGMTDRPFGNLLDMTMVQDRIENGCVIKNGNRGRIIQGFMVGEQAKAISRMSESERADFFHQRLKEVYAEPEDNICDNTIVSSDSVCWHDEEWSKGAYPSFTPKEFSAMSLRDISKPECNGLIYFAGDHTSPYPGWMEGALQSGQRVAKEIIKAIWPLQW